MSRGLALGFFLALTNISMAAGQDKKGSHEFSIGITGQQADTTVLASTARLPPVDIKLKDFGVEDQDTSWFAEYRWRFSERWLLDVFAYQYTDSGLQSATKDFNYNGVEFTAGTLISSRLDIDTYAVDVLYSVHRSNRGELLLGAGLHALRIEGGFSGVVLGANQSRTFSASSETLLAPIPNLRAQANYAFSDRIGADITAGWLSASVDEYDGSFAYLNARLRLRITERASVSAGYQFTDIDISQQRSENRKLALEGGMHGPLLQLNWAF